MLHRLFAIISVISLLLCLATVVLWVRSYWIADGFTKYGYDESTAIYSLYGRFTYYDQDDSIMTTMGLWPRLHQVGHWKYSPDEDVAAPDTGERTWFNRLGVAVQWREKVPIPASSNRPILGSRTRLIFPHWLLATALCLLPACWGISRFRRKAGTRGKCRQCGYDLRASKDRCPECGTIIPVGNQAGSVRSDGDR
jgi:hypothetical protein